MHTGKGGKLQKHYEGGLGADSQEGKKKTTKSKEAIEQKSSWLPLMEQSHTAETPPGVILFWFLNVHGYIACEPGSPREGRKQFKLQVTLPRHTD